MKNESQNELPDIEALTALVNQWFREAPGADTGTHTAPANFGFLATPGAIPNPGNANYLPNATSLPATPPVKATPSTVAEQLALPSPITPRIAPTQAQSVDPHGLQSTVLPALPRGGGLAASVPEAVLAALPASLDLPDTPDQTGRPIDSQNTSTASHYIFEEAKRSEAPIDLSALDKQLTAFPGPILPGVQHLTGRFGDGRGAASPSVIPSYYFLESAPAQSEAPVPDASARDAFDVQTVRKDFPILSTRLRSGRPLVWFDNAATTQKPRAVIERLSYFYEHENSNVHRAAHELAARATDAYESARKKVASFIGASSPDEIVFVRGTTEGINLVAQSWGRLKVKEGDEIVLSHLEHHANIVPWQMLAAEKGARLRVIPVDETGQIRLDEYQKLLSPRTRIVAVSQVSNALGTVVPVKEIIDLAHRAGARVLIDAAQSVAHLPVNVRALDADFFVFSGHKIFGPTGIGVVYGKSEVLEQSPPWQGGGNMIEDVSFDKTTYQAPPARFEAGTGNIADAVGLSSALDYVRGIGLENIARHEHDLLDYGTTCLLTIPRLRLIGAATEKASILSFVIDGFTTREIGQALSEEGIAVRAGHHCAQPILRRFGLESTVRASIAFYNTFEEIDILTATLKRLVDTRRF